MFSGIITDVGRVRAVTAGGDTRIDIATGFDIADLVIGASVCCAGACLTVIETGEEGGEGWFAVTASAETLSRTTLGAWAKGTPVNLERALKLGDEMGGHLVSGHVDGIATVAQVTADGDSRRIALDAPDGLQSMIAAKGSIALDGVSLTVNAVDDRRFDVNVIPHTLEATTLAALQAGDRVNLEIDMLARYVARLLAAD